MITCLLNHDCERFLAETFYAVEATSFERHTLWAQHARGSVFPPVDRRNGERAFRLLAWEELNPGGMVTVGSIGRGKKARGVCLSTTFARIEGRVVLFHEITSQLADHLMAEAWLAENCPNWKEAHCDASGFGRCLSAIKAFNGAA